MFEKAEKLFFLVIVVVKVSNLYYMSYFVKNTITQVLHISTSVCTLFHMFVGSYLLLL